MSRRVPKQGTTPSVPGIIEPLGWSNWRAQRAGTPELGAFEFAWYTDIWPTAEAKHGLGPLQILNPVGASEREETALTLVARVSMHIDGRPPRKRIRIFTDYSRYVGVDIGEEYAYLASLAYGMRCRSGGITRRFDEGDTDVRGDPVAWDLSPLEVQQPARFHGSQLPLFAKGMDDRKRQLHLDDEAALDLLRRYPHASRKKAIALVRAARMYGQAVWQAEGNPEQAWLLLIAACEIAGATLYGSYDPKNRRRSEPSERQATERFRRFLTEYAPPPPPVRPQWGQLDWSKMRSHADWIYHWRSRTLHEGIPFPPALVESPRKDEHGVYNEVPMGLSTMTGGSSWKASDTPMLFSTFEYLVRGALQKWWRKTAIRP
jgi:hypothetical protein